WVIVDLLMTQPYPFTHTADTGHAKASAAKRLCSPHRHLLFRYSTDQLESGRQLGSYPETLVLYRTGPAVSVPGDSGKSGGARPIQLCEGSRPWGSIYANSMVLGI